MQWHRKNSVQAEIESKHFCHKQAQMSTNYQRISLKGNEKPQKHQGREDKNHQDTKVTQGSSQHFLPRMDTNDKRTCCRGAQGAGSTIKTHWAQRTHHCQWSILYHASRTLFHVFCFTFQKIRQWYLWLHHPRSTFWPSAHGWELNPDVLKNREIVIDFPFWDMGTVAIPFLFLGL